MTRNGKQVSPRWSYSAGERGVSRCRVFEHHRTGLLSLEVREQGRRVRIALGHRDRAAAKATADKTAAAIRTGEPVQAPSLTLRQLFDNYGAEVTPTKGVSSQQHDRRAARLLLEGLGMLTHANSLTRRDWDAYIRFRKQKGDTRRGKRVRGRPTNGRAIEGDLKFLVAALHWAVAAGLLDRHPLKGMPWPRPISIKRPIVTAQQVAALRSVAPLVDPMADLMFVLCHQTGHRVGAVRQLRWSDINASAGSVRWRAEWDKRRNEHETPLTETALTALSSAHGLRRQVGDAWVFPCPTDPSKPVSKHLVRDWWERMESLAGLEPEPGRGWHSLRRLFATDLKRMPLADLCALGGWKDPQTVLKCYMKPDTRRSDKRSHSVRRCRNATLQESHEWSHRELQRKKGASPEGQNPRQGADFGAMRRDGIEPSTY